MKIIVIGATGTVGSGVVTVLKGRGHEVIEASRKGPEAVDLTDPGTVRALFDRVGAVDHVVSCAGSVVFKQLHKLEHDELVASATSKLVGNIELVREACARLPAGGSVTLTTGILATKPWPGGSAISAINAGLEAFVRAAVLDEKRVRINAVSPPLITETAKAVGRPTEGSLLSVDNAEAYLKLIEGEATGQVVHPLG